MEYIKLNNWCIDANKAVIALLRFHVELNILKKDNCILFKLTVTDSDMENITFNFYSLEDAISFTQETISKCSTKDEIRKEYQKKIEKGEFRLPGGIKPPKSEKLLLNKNEVDEILIDYYSKGKNYSVSIRNDIYIDYYKKPKISFYLTEHLDYDGIKKDIEYMLTEYDLKTALNDYMNSYGYEVDNFNYIYTYECDEKDITKYEGIELKLKRNDLEHNKKLVKKI